MTCERSTFAWVRLCRTTTRAGSARGSDFSEVKEDGALALLFVLALYWVIGFVSAIMFRIIQGSYITLL